MRELGSALGISEDAAKMRVSRAVERLRSILGARGVTCTAAALGTALAQGLVTPAPPQLVSRLATHRFPISAPPESKAASKSIPPVALASLCTAVVLVTSWIMFRTALPGPASTGADATAVASGGEAIQVPTSGAESASGAPTNTTPEPAALLEGVAAARNRPAAGLVDFEVESYDFVRKETNRLHLSILFDGEKLRADQTGREYAYVGVGEDAARQAEASIQQQGLDRESAVTAGLLEGFTAHDTTVYDGKLLLSYRETRGRGGDATISDPNKSGSSVRIFDPRCLGLAAHLQPGTTAEMCLGFQNAESIRLVGREAFDAGDAWHLEVRRASGESQELWVDASLPQRVLKVVSGTDVIVSRFAGSHDLLPAEVLTVTSRNGAPAFGTRFQLAHADFSLAPEPATWTLAGLHMEKGTPVTDVRMHRRIGYWDGSGVSEWVAREPRQETSPAPPDRGEMHALLEQDPGSASALEAAEWIILNTPDNEEVDLAVSVIESQHIQSPDLTRLAQELERVRPRSAGPLLQHMIEKNRDPDVRAAACFTLARFREDQSEFGKDAQATAEAEKLYRRIVNELGGPAKNGSDLIQKSTNHLYELQHLTVGKPAPAFAGTTLDGQKVNLQDYRGQVVVLAFCDKHFSEAPDFKKFAARFSGRSVKLITVCCEDNRATAEALLAQYDITWPLILDGRSGPLSEAWNIHGWTSTFVVDQRGIIRHRGLRFETDLSRAAQDLLSHAE